MLSTSMRRLVRVWTLFVLVFLYAPLLLVMLNAFNTSKTFAFPPSGFTLRWWGDAWASTGMWRSLGNSMVVGLCATALALTLGTFNNIQARLRRLGTSLEDASADLGASSWQTFRYVTFPMMRGALLAGAILAFALSFDEIVVTTFTAGPTVQTLPIWIFGNLFRPNQAPVINVVAATLTVVAVIPVWLAQRFGGDPATTRV